MRQVHPVRLESVLPDLIDESLLVRSPSLEPAVALERLVHDHLRRR